MNESILSVNLKFISVVLAFDFKKPENKSIIDFETSILNFLL